MTFHMAPPFLSGTDANGRPRKRSFGPWILPVMRLLAKGKRLRGSALDPFGYGAERRAERAAIAGYEADCETVFQRLEAGNLGIAVELLSLPDSVRGFGPVKAASAEAAAARRADLTQTLLEVRQADTQRMPEPAE